jgi:hypothetical protein
MRVVATVMAGPMPHYFFELGPCTTLAFFEVKGAPTFAKPAAVVSDRAIQLNHVALGGPDETALEQLRTPNRLQDVHGS